jgi:uncharacterized protein (TIGR02145 family)
MLTNLAYGGTEAGTKFTSGAGQSTTTNVSASGTNWNRTNPPYNNQKQWVDPTTAAVTLAQITDNTRCATAYRTTPESIDYTECGYLYNWCAALGNASASCNTSTANTTITNAGVGLCPTGWRLPTGGADGEFAYLNGMMAGDGGTSTTNDDAHKANWLSSGTWRSVLTGWFYAGDGLAWGSSYVRYWSGTTTTSATTAFVLSIDSTGLGFYGSLKWIGNPVRCVTAN